MTKQFMVIQKPKPKYRAAFVSTVAVVEANNASEAVRVAMSASLGQEGFIAWGKISDYNKPTAELLELGKAYLV